MSKHRRPTPNPAEHRTGTTQPPSAPDDAPESARLDDEARGVLLQRVARRVERIDQELGIAVEAISSHSKRLDDHDTLFKAMRHDMSVAIGEVKELNGKMESVKSLLGRILDQLMEQGKLPRPHSKAPGSGGEEDSSR